MISVIGAGPAGCIAAINSAKKSDTIIYDSQGRGERRIQCSGLLSRSGLLSLGINPLTDSSKDLVRNSVRGARIYSPFGRRVLEVDGGKNKAFVLDRREFDNYFIDKAIGAGAKIIKETVDAERMQEIRNKSEKTILATGTNYNIQKSLGIPHPKKHLFGAQYEMKIECDPEYVEMYLNVPGFFSWIIPAGDNARIGLCTTINPVPYLEHFIKKLSKENRIKDPKIIDRNYGIIPIYDPGLKTQHKDISLVGDAAGHVKATTGGGIILGGIAAQYACEGDYEKKWRKTVGRELYLHLQIRKILARLSEKNTDKLIQTLSEKRKTFETAGDMDKASNLMLSLAKDPAFAAKLLIQSPGILYDLMSAKTVI
jgi:digeranylgeranylglycerophospholipid reductase